MASSSAASIHKSFKYDVFLSFRGEDTRTNFIDHLYTALKQQSIYTYKDDEAIRKGKKISDELIASIEDSKLYIIVFSKNYASSSWCLDELVRIMECHKTTEHTAYPVFYDVEPTEVRKQIGAVGEAFSKHENDEASGKWKDALKQAADLAGWELKNTANGHEAKFIQRIVEEISLKLRSIDFNIDEKLAGMKTRIDEVLSYLETGTDDVRIIGIKGIGGGGKTTLARAAFDQISFQFEGKSFVENVREVSNTSLSGLKSLQNQVLKDVLNDQGMHVSGVHDGKNMMKSRMCGRKVLVVLDDVDHIDQLEALAGDLNWFKLGSRIIITTRDEQVLIAHRVKLILDINLLSCEEAICLFSRYAFGREIPIQKYEELSGQVIRYAAGLPLTIKVLGSFLCGKNESEWIDALERLKTIPLKETLKKLELSYMSLEDDYKEIFLNIACILKGWPKESTIEALESCGFHAINGLTVLHQKSLITIYDDKYIGECVGMHDHLEEMGRNIVRHLHPDKPKKHSRLWIDEEIKDIFANDLGTKATRYIRFYLEKVDLEIVIRGLQKMKELRFFHVSPDIEHYFPRERKYDNVSQYFPNALQYLHWYGYPLWSLPKTFLANDIVSLQMPHSNIVQLWEGGERKVSLPVVRRFVQTVSEQVVGVGVIRGVRPDQQLVKIVSDELVKLMRGEVSELTFAKSGPTVILLAGLQGVGKTTVSAKLALYLKQQVDVPVYAVGTAVKPAEIAKQGLQEAKKKNVDVVIMDTAGRLQIKETTVDDMVKLVEQIVSFYMKALNKLKFLDLSHSKFTTLDLGLIPNLKTLSLGRCLCLVQLHKLTRCINLISVDLSDSKLKIVDLRSAVNLNVLNLKDCNALVELLLPVGCLKLTHLHCTRSKLMTLDIGQALNLETLILDESHHLVKLQMPGECLNLKSLNLTNSKLKTLDIGLTPSLKDLDLRNCYYLEELHMADKCQKLESLNIMYSNLRTLDIGSTPNLKDLDLRNCYDLRELHMADKCQKLESLNIMHSKLRTFDIGLTPNLKSLFLNNCYILEELHMVGKFEKLISLNISQTKLKTLDLRLTPNLKNLYLKECKNLVQVHAPTGCLQNLVYLDLSGCLRFTSFRFDKRFGASSSTDESLEDCPSAELHLTAKTLEKCPLHPDNNLPKFEFECFYKDYPSLTRNLETLISVGLCACTNLEMFSRSICHLWHLRKLKLEGYPEAPKDLDQLQYLEELSLSTASMKYIPDSICMLKHLKILELRSCLFLEKLPDDLGQLECLEKLTLLFTKIKSLPDSICMLKHLKSLVLYYSLLEKLPEDLGRLEHLEQLNVSECKFLRDIPNSICNMKCLKELHVAGTCISHLPQNIHLLKGLRITGSRGQLQSCGFGNKIQSTSAYHDSCYVNV